MECARPSATLGANKAPAARFQWDEADGRKQENKIKIIPFFVEQQKAAVIQRLGKYNRVATAGLNWRLPFFDENVGEVNLRVKQLDVDVETKTQDNVFVKVIVSVQYYVLPEKI